MIYKTENINSIPKNVACIGYFDGVHLGHQELIKKTIELSKKNNLIPLVISFYPDPESVVSKKDVYQITTLDKRIELFNQFGIKDVLLIDFNEKLMNKDANDFIKEYIIKSNVKTIVCGFDFKFGYKTSGDINLLKKYLDVVEIPEVKYENKKISSTLIRQLIKNNELELANKLLGHD